MDMVQTVSVLAGSVVLLCMFLSIAYEGVATKHNSQKNLVSALNNKWQKLTVSVS
jgi:hypothetical protein